MPAVEMRASCTNSCPLRQEKRVPGTCEKIDFTDFDIMIFQ